jgi:NSS family neurotransmitter:Na+ symporter
MRQLFSSRFALVLAALGMAIGTGNICRFPRIAAEYEGGAFLIPWAIFLFTWSIPILIAEFTLGKVTNRGPIGAFSKLLGKQAAWMGAFMAFVTLMIAAYYSVVTGWTLKYAIDAVMHLGDAAQPIVSPTEIDANHIAAISAFQGFAGKPEALFYHLAAVGVGIVVVWRGIRGGIELATKILVPFLFLLLIFGVVWALTSLKGASKGIEYFFTPNWSHLSSPKIWIAALSQSAWSTGAGWGLILAYGAYARRNEDAVAVNHAAGLGNNSASLLAGLFIFPAVFIIL